MRRDRFLPNREAVQDHLRLQSQFLRTVVVVLIITVFIFIHFCAGHLLFVYVCTPSIFGAIIGVFNIIACIYRRGVQTRVYQVIYG